MPEGSVTIEQDHFPEVANKASRRVEALGLKDKLGNTEARRGFFRDASNERYKKMLGYLNSVVRQQPIEHDYKNGRLPLEDTPPLTDKEPLMTLTFDTVRQILSDTSLDDRTALRLAGLTLAGAVNYIHPYENGNGRVGRVTHYIMEFGTERGNRAFNEELYAIIAKIPMYDTDKIKALSDTPPAELEQTLKAIAKNTGDPQENLASRKVKVFLQMMQGAVNAPIQEPINRRDLTTGAVKTIPAGGIDGKSLYLKEYLDYSSIPYRKPDEVPPGAKRNLVQKVGSTRQSISLNLDLVE